MPKPANVPSRGRQALVLVATTGLILAGIWLIKGGQDETGVSSVELTGDVAAAAPAVGEPAPDFAATAVDGAAVRLSDLRGQPVWLVFGATWCSNCRAETEDIEAVYEQSDEVAVVAIYVGEPATTVTAYAERLGLTYSQVADPATDLGSLYRVLGLPTHYFIDAEGNVASIAIGGLSQQAATERLAALS
ncbi:MAG: TlpA family protein disulfide reductase [Bifidobacteriaceae bacterium]|jgi:peroxiredoxin|nr:TlpA family protein disulfide reductase [Bifidobacteriaceae bacterium]